ncbi:MAG: NIPSNAP family protein, partial [Usitatibacteraceae bacterium]
VPVSSLGVTNEPEMHTRRHLLSFALCLGACTVMPIQLEDPVLELRIYQLKPEHRDNLITLFESKFIESQEMLGARIVGTFRVPEQPDRFVWLRTFASMQSRAVSLQAFYTSDTWRANSRAANETMISVDDVYLLRSTGKRLNLPSNRPSLGVTRDSPTAISVELFPLSAVAEVELCVRSDPTVLATYVTEESPNNFPALPVREDRVVVVMRRDITGSSRLLCGAPSLRLLRLAPTARSLLR